MNILHKIDSVAIFVKLTYCTIIEGLLTAPWRRIKPFLSHSQIINSLVFAKSVHILYLARFYPEQVFIAAANVAALLNSADLLKVSGEAFNCIMHDWEYLAQRFRGVMLTIILYLLEESYIAWNVRLPLVFAHKFWTVRSSKLDIPSEGI